MSLRINHALTTIDVIFFIIGSRPSLAAKSSSFIRRKGRCIHALLIQTRTLSINHPIPVGSGKVRWSPKFHSKSCDVKLTQMKRRTKSRFCRAREKLAGGKRRRRRRLYWKVCVELLILRGSIHWNSSTTTTMRERKSWSEIIGSAWFDEKCFNYQPGLHNRRFDFNQASNRKPFSSHRENQLTQLANTEI